MNTLAVYFIRLGLGFGRGMIFCGCLVKNNLGRAMEKQFRAENKPERKITMSIDMYTVWQKLAYLIVHKTTLWLLFVLLGTALASWRLAVVLDKHNARQREAALARKTAVGYAATAVILWLLSVVLG
ncbi:hypothetical protein [Sporolituus thermophilus]|nr:hypothetical protein [Sporolituus thermophilus]